MTKFTRIFKQIWVKTINSLKPNEQIGAAKEKWNNLAKENARYYVLTDRGEQITEEEFRAAGMYDVEILIKSDPKLQGFLLNSQSKSVLEIGCGIGRLSEFIAPLFKEFHGVDISEEMIVRARERVANAVNAQFYATDGMSFPLSNESIDFVFSFIVFQHMPTKEVVRKNIEEISRVLRRGGGAKIQLRGIPVSKDQWYYGPSFNARGLNELLSGLPLRILNVEGEGQKYFWLIFEKEV